MSQQDTRSTEFNPDNLYREESYSDRTVGNIRRMIPVKKDGSDDPSRPETFIGQTQVMTQMGPVPLTFELQAATLEEAGTLFSEGVQKAYKEMLQEMEEMRRQQQQEQSSIVVPGGSGKIQL